MCSRATAIALVLLVATTSAASGQARTLAMGPSLRDTTDARLRAHRSPPGPERVVLPAIVVGAEPGSFQVVEIPVPPEAVRAGSSRWAIDPLRPVSVLSHREGALTTPSVSRRSHPSLLVTLAVPRQARSGVLPAATVRFMGEEGQLVELPVHLMIATTRRVEITVLEPVRGVRPGERFALRFRLTNLGNTAEQVEVRTELPPTWHATIDGDRTTALARHEVVERILQVNVPPGSATGAAVVRLIAMVDGVPAASAESRITVQRDIRSEGDGPLATFTTALGHDADGTTSNGVAVEVDGKLTDQISVMARLSHTTGTAAGSYALARAGLYPTRPSIRFTAPDWSLALGIMGETFSDLTGTGLGGEGVSGSVRRGRFKATALLGRSIPDRGNEAGFLAGGTLAVDAGAVIVTGTATRLSEQRNDPRRLQAIALGAQLPDVLSGALAAEVAQRWTSKGSHPGAAVSYDRQTGSGNLSLRAMHAPGGSGAFARATNEVAASASNSIGEAVSWSGAFWASEDRGSSTLGRLTSLSASLGVARRMTRAVGVSLAVQHNGFHTDGTTAGFGSAQTEGSLAVVVAAGAFRARGAATIGEAQRTTRFAGQAAVEESGYRRTLEGSLQWTGTKGSLDLAARVEHNDARSGTLPQQIEVSLRATDIRLMTVAGIHLAAGAEIRRNAWPGFAPARWTTGANAEAKLPLGFSIAATAERNPYLQGAGGGWLYGLRVGRTIGLPRVSSAATGGAVFEDRNGNGMRDPGEGGLANVVVRHHGGTAVTNGAGRYRFPTEATGVIEVDPASLPIGMVPAPLTSTGTAGTLAVVAVAPVQVMLSMANDSLGTGDPVDLSHAIVMARHTSGRTWVARQVRPGVAAFDALPPGRYQVVLDLLEVAEPVEVRGTLPAFEVVAGTVHDSVSVTLHARRVTIKRLGASAPGITEGRP